jgi:hypothetical protein
VSGLLVKIPRHESVDAGARMPCCDGLQHSLEIGVRLNAVELAGLDERRDAGPGSATFVMAREQRVFGVEGDRANGALDNVTVHLDSAVLKKQLQSVYVFCDVGELLAKVGFCGDAGSLDFEPDLKFIHQWFGLLLPYGLAVCSRLSPDRVFDLVELCDTLEPFTGDGRAITVMDFLELAACVRPAIGQFDRPRSCAPGWSGRCN